MAPGVSDYGPTSIAMSFNFAARSERYNVETVSALDPDPERPLSDMANIHSQIKRNLRTERERQENRHYSSSVKTHFRRLEQAVEAKDADKAQAEFRELSSRIDRAARTGVLHKNTAARKKSRAARLLSQAS